MTASKTETTKETSSSFASSIELTAAYSPQKDDKVYTIHEVEQHRTSSDFWTVVDNVVYDLTKFQHPGGDRVIMNAAGADATVLFHQYHLLSNLKNMEQTLKKYRIGVVDKASWKSPQMGSFYEKLAVRVRRQMLDILAKPDSPGKHPLYGKITWFVDCIALIVTLAVAGYIWMTTLTGQQEESPSFTILLLLHLATPNVSSLRIEGQQHANGHAQLWDSPGTSYIAEVVGEFLGVPGMFAYGLPYEEKNPRSLLSKPRHEAQHEFPEGRGFTEHMAIHHVRGAILEDDYCAKLVSVLGLVRFSPQQTYLKYWHDVQYHFIVQALLNIVVEFADATKIIFAHSRIIYVFGTLYPAGELLRGTAILNGVGASIVATYAYGAFLYYYCSSSAGLSVYLISAAIKQYFGLYGVQAFFAQHVWDFPQVDETVMNKDWGKYNCESTFSWWATEGLDDWRHMFNWGWAPKWVKGAATPSTLTYHLEHTMFPGLNYLHLPTIAPTVRAVAKECGITYPLLKNYAAVLDKREHMLRQHATSLKAKTL